MLNILSKQKLQNPQFLDANSTTFVEVRLLSTATQCVLNEERLFDFHQGAVHKENKTKKTKIKQPPGKS